MHRWKDEQLTENFIFKNISIIKLMGSAITKEDINDLEKTFLRKDNIKVYKKKCKECKECLNCIPSFFTTVRYYYNALF